MINWCILNVPTFFWIGATCLLSVVVEEDLYECTLERRSIRFITSFVAVRLKPLKKE